jgi:hypothetical protein
VTDSFPSVLYFPSGKYKTGAPIITELIRNKNVKVRLGLSSGKPVHPFFIPLLQAGAYVYSDTAIKEFVLLVFSLTIYCG